MAQVVDLLGNKAKGQALYEAVVLMPLLIFFISTFFSFLYDQLWTQIVEEIVHETIVCEETLGKTFCLAEANFKANRNKLLGIVIIHRPSPGEYMAEQFIFGKKILWKTLIINKKLPMPKSNRKKDFQ